MNNYRNFTLINNNLRTFYTLKGKKGYYKRLFNEQLVTNSMQKQVFEKHHVEYIHWLNLLVNRRAEKRDITKRPTYKQAMLFNLFLIKAKLKIKNHNT